MMKKTSLKKATLPKNSIKGESSLTKKLIRDTPIKKKPTKFSLSIRSRHPSIDDLRNTVFLPKKAIYRHGSTTETSLHYEINSIDAIKTSSSKLAMKQAFDKEGVKHLPWIKLENAEIKDGALTDGKTTLKFPVVIKHYFGSRGEGNYKIDSLEDYNKFLPGKSRNKYIIESYFNGCVEFRVHITKYGPIYSLRKLLKEDIPQEKRWIRNDSTCVWITEFLQNLTHTGEFINFKNDPNPKFDKPGNWEDIIKECKKALTAVNGDILAVDVKAQSNKNSKNQKREKVDFYILEVNSAPSMGKITTEIYRRELPNVFKDKYSKII